MKVLMTYLVRRRLGLREPLFVSLGFLLDQTLMIQLLDVRSLILFLLITIDSIIIFVAQKEMYSGRLNLDIRVTSGSSGDRNSLGVVPDRFSPQLFDKGNSPHGFLSNPVDRRHIGSTGTRHDSLQGITALVSYDIGIHSTIYHVEKKSLNNSVQFMVLRWRVGGLEIHENLFLDERSETR